VSCRPETFAQIKRRPAEKAYVTSIVFSEIPIPMRVVLVRAETTFY
jgi:hypothetical protein